MELGLQWAVPWCRGVSVGTIYETRSGDPMSAPSRCILPAAWATVLLFASPHVVRAEQAPPRLDHVAIPTAQSVDLTCDPEKPDYTGTVRVTLDVKQATEVLRFH